MHDALPSSVRTTSRFRQLCFPLLRIVAAVCLWPALAIAAPVSGRVVGPDGVPLAGATVVVSGATAAPRAVTTGADGTFTVDVPDGPVTVRAFTTGLDAPPVRVSAGATDLVLTLAVRAVSESLTVTAAPVDTPLSLRGDSVSVLTRQDLDQRQLVTLGDALRLVPGVTVNRNGGPGTVTSVLPRGGESDFTLVLVDGVRANAFGGGMDLSQAPIAEAERVEVVRGPQSALYGSDAIGGVIQIVTNRSGAAMASGFVEAGGRESRNGALSARGGTRGLSAGVTLSRQQDGGFTGTAEADGTPVSNDDGELSQVSAQLTWRGASGTEVGTSLTYVDSDRGSPGPFGSNPVGNFFGVDRVARSVSWRRTAGGYVTQPLGGAASRVRLRAEADTADFDFEYRSAFGSRGETRRHHGRLQVDAAVAVPLSLTAGGELLRESGRSTYITAGPVAVPVERGVLAAFAEARWQPMARVAFTAGTRAERITRDALAANPSAFSPRPAFADDTVVSVNPKITAAWTVAESPSPQGASTRLHAAAGTGIRPPDAFEIAFTDNAGLRPERSRSVEAGVVQTALAGRVQADATLFLNSYDDLIIAVGRFSRTSRYQTDNIANARARGAELALAWRPRAAFGARAHYTWLDTEILAVDGTDGQAPAPFAVGDRLLRRPRHLGGLDLAWTGARLQGFATAIFRGKALDVEPNFGASGGLFDNPGYGMLTVGAAWTVVPRVSVHARVVNVTGAAYEEAFGYPALGRTLYAGVRLAARR
jgi:vitamin B12 transporter